MIYLDSDGVFAGWRSHVMPKYFPELTVKQFNALPDLKRRGMLRDIYQREPKLFYNLKPVEGMGAVLDAVDRMGVPWAILTSGAEDHYDHQLVVDCKQRWYDKHFGVPADKVIVTENSGQKKEYAGEGELLVDDFGRNCREWALKGGAALWVHTESPNARDICRHIQNFVDDPVAHNGSILQIR